MSQDFDSDFDLPRPTKVKLAKIAIAGSLVTVGLIGTLLTFALDSFKTALANIGIPLPGLVSFPTLAAVLAVLFVLAFAGVYYALTQYVRGFILQLGP